MMTAYEKETLRQAASILHGFRQRTGEDELILHLGSINSHQQCDVQSVTVGIWSMGQTWTGNAVHLEDAVLIARGKVKDEEERRRKAKEESSK
jgi:putative ubiquitin-RnfH superfamily antitoxin RatB of RatAB toxin-antitoxin module